MKFIPFISETLVLEVGCIEAAERIDNNTRQQGDGIEEGDRLFKGIVDESGFKISLDIREHVNFLPLISGKMENTSSGCILFLTYQMFWGSMIMVGFWSVLAILFTLFFLYIHNEPLYGWISLSFGVVNYIITLLSFNRMVKRSRSQFQKLLELSNK